MSHNSSKRYDLRLIKTSPMQPVAQFYVDALPQLLTTTVTTGLIANTYPYDPTTSVTNWSSRFGSLFREYRIVKAVNKFILFSSSTAGQMNAWTNEKSVTAPSATLAGSERAKRFPLSDVDREHTLSWTPQDPLDLQYIDTSVAAAVGNLKVYTDAGNYGAPIAVTNVGTLQTTYLIQFREFK